MWAKDGGSGVPRLRTVTVRARGGEAGDAAGDFDAHAFGAARCAGSRTWRRAPEVAAGDARAVPSVAGPAGELLADLILAAD